MPRSPTLERAYRPIAAVLGVVFFIAAALKFVDAGLTVPSPVTAMVPRWALGVVPLAEAALGAWLASGVWRFRAWLTALPVLVVFSLHSLSLAADSRPSCGCLGRVEVPPWLTLGFDVVMLALLVRCQPGWRGWPADTPGARLTWQTAAVGAVAVGGVIGWAHLRYGSVELALAAARGSTMAVWPPRLDFGEVEAGTRAERLLRFVNLSAESVQVVMVESSCSCAEVGGLPATVPPGGSVDLPVRFKVGRSPGPTRQTGRLRTSAGDVGFGMTAWVAAGPAGPAADQQEGKP